jgi:hypothetical protein
MNIHENTSKSILESLRRSISKTLERKRRLGQYAVIWKDGHSHKLIPTPKQPASSLQEDPSQYPYGKEES